jgi:anthranilate/para-aminobenzoate synthase component I
VSPFSLRKRTFSAEQLYLRGHDWTGGRIVADSDPERELDETAWKALQLG